MPVDSIDPVAVSVPLYFSPISGHYKNCKVPEHFFKIQAHLIAEIKLTCTYYDPMWKIVPTNTAKCSIYWHTHSFPSTYYYCNPKSMLGWFFACISDQATKKLQLLENKHRSTSYESAELLLLALCPVGAVRYEGHHAQGYTGSPPLGEVQQGETEKQIYWEIKIWAKHLRILTWVSELENSNLKPSSDECPRSSSCSGRPHKADDCCLPPALPWVVAAALALQHRSLYKKSLLFQRI